MVMQGISKTYALHAFVVEQNLFSRIFFIRIFMDFDEFISLLFI
tara:strand:- start:144 stop:275 length:132 start_codon:yes stop_codon:yes gene_type:complete